MLEKKMQKKLNLNFYPPSHIVDTNNIKCSLKKLYKKNISILSPPLLFFFTLPVILLISKT